MKPLNHIAYFKYVDRMPEEKFKWECEVKYLSVCEHKLNISVLVLCLGNANFSWKILDWYLPTNTGNLKNGFIL